MELIFFVIVVLNQSIVGKLVIQLWKEWELLDIFQKKDYKEMINYINQGSINN